MFLHSLVGNIGGSNFWQKRHSFPMGQLTNQSLKGLSKIVSNYFFLPVVLSSVVLRTVVVSSVVVASGVVVYTTVVVTSLVVVGAAVVEGTVEVTVVLTTVVVASVVEASVCLKATKNAQFIPNGSFRNGPIKIISNARH